MTLDLDQPIGQERRRWIALGGALDGVEVQIRYASPREQEKFRQRCIRDGILKKDSHGHDIASGRDEAFFKAFATQYVCGWRGDIKPEGAEYDAEKMGAVLGAYTSAFEQVSRAVGEEADFFSANGSGSTGK